MPTLLAALEWAFYLLAFVTMFGCALGVARSRREHAEFMRAHEQRMDRHRFALSRSGRHF